MTVPSLTVATLGFEENQLTLVLAVSFVVLPTVRLTLDDEMPVEVPFLTVKAQVEELLPSDTVIVVVPAAFAVRTPFESIVATDVLELLHLGV